MSFVERFVEFHKIDLVNAIAVALLLAIYTGLVASRIFAFYQLRYKSIIWLYELMDYFDENVPSPHDFQWKLTQRSYPTVLELKALGHDAAALKIGGIIQNLIEYTATACRVPITAGRIPDLPAVCPKAMTEALRFQVRLFLKSGLDDWLGMLGSMTPNIWPIITPNPFPNYILFDGHFIGLNVPRKSWLEVTRLRIAKAFRVPPRYVLSLGGRRSDCGNCCENCNRTI